MSASQSHNLFGLQPSALDDIQLPHDYKYVCLHPLKVIESRIWRVPALSTKIIYVLKSRLAQPRHHLLIGPLKNVATPNWQFLTIDQYVHLINIVNSQLVNIAGKSKSMRNDYQRIPDLIDAFHSRFPYIARRKNDNELIKCHARIFDVYDAWRRYGFTQFVAESLAVDLNFSPYYSSFLKSSSGVLTPPAFRLLSFCQDFDIILHDSVRVIQRSSEAHHRLPSLHAFTVRCLRSLQASHPTYFTRYHSAAVRQVRFTVLSTVRKLD